MSPMMHHPQIPPPYRRKIHWDHIARWLIVLLLLLIFLQGHGWAQPQGNTITVYASGAPTGSCFAYYLYDNTADNSVYACISGTWHQIGSGGPGGGVTSFAAPGVSWPSWLVPTVTNSTTTPSLAVAASAIPNASLATQTANTVLGALTATTPSGLALPSCAGATNALSWTSGTGFGCNTITPGTGTVTSVDQTVPSWLTVTGNPVTTSGTLAIAANTGQTSHRVVGTCNAGTSVSLCALVAGDLPTIPLSGLATQAADTVVQNATGGSAAPTAIAIPSCSAGTSALTYNTTSHAWGCNTITGGVSSFSGDGTLISNSSSTGAVTATLANAAAHKFWGNNTGSTAAPGYQSIGTGDLPAIPLSGLATQAADTVVANATGSTAAPTAVAFPTSGTNGCAGASNALTYNTSTHAFGCNTISGSGNTTSTSLTTNVVPRANGANSIVDSLLTDDGTTDTYTGTGGYSGKKFTATGTTAGFWAATFAATSAAVDPCASTLTAGGICTQAPTSGTSYVKTLAGTGSTGMPLYTYAGGSPNVLTESIVTAIPNGFTGTTQTLGSNDTKLATDAYVDGYVRSTTMVKQLTADMTCGTGGTNSSCTAATTVTGMSWTLPSSTQTWHFTCDMIVGQATAATANQWLVQTATNGATNIAASYDMHTAATAVTGGAITGVASTTTAQQITPSWTLGATATKMPARITGTIEGASSSGTVLNIMVLAPTVADLLTIYRGSSCRIW